MSEGGLVMPSSCTAAMYNNNNNNNGRASNVVPRRKFSFPALLQSPGLHADLGISGPSLAVATARRRFSNVSDVVSRKLSHTIGWRTAVPTEQISQQGKALCVQYVRWKLKRAGLYTKKNAGTLRYDRVNAETVASADVVGPGYFIPPQSGTDGGEQNDGLRRVVFPAVLRVCLQLEKLDPKLYASGTTSTAAVQPPQRSAFRRNAVATATAAVILVSVSRELFRAGAQVTWAKVVSLMCVAAGLAVDCARHGHAEQLPDLIEAFGEVIEDDLAAWIHYNGGWVSTPVLQHNHYAYTSGSRPFIHCAPFSLYRKSFLYSQW